MKIDIREGLYRIFVLASLYPCCVGFLQTINYQRLRYVCYGVICGLCVFVSFFIFEWIISGFINSTFESNGIKKIIYSAIDKLKKMNYLLFFLFSLFIIGGLSVAIYENLKILSEKDIVIENLENKIKDYECILEDPVLLKNQLDYISAARKEELENIKNIEKNKQIANSLKMFKNLPPLPPIRNNYYYIDTPLYPQQRPIIYHESQPVQTNTHTYNPYQISNDMLQEDINNLRMELMYRDMQYERDHSRY